jgi:hypothetical protein
MFSWSGGVFFMLPFTKLLLQWTNNFVGGRWTRGSRRTFIWSVMEDFSKVPGVKDFIKM